MARARRYTQGELVKRLKKEGLEVKKGGTHGIKMGKEGMARPVIIPRHGGRILPIGMSEEILQQAEVQDD